MTRLISESPIEVFNEAQGRILSLAGLTVERWREPMQCDDLTVVYGPIQGETRKILKIDREWSLRDRYYIGSEDLVLLFEYLAEPRSRYEEPPTISLDIAVQTIKFLKETN